MVSAQKQWFFIFLTILLSITVAIPVHAQTATPPSPRDVLLGAIAEQAKRDQENGAQESTEGLNLLFGEQSQQVGMTLPEVKKVYEDAYSAAAAGRPWYADLTKDWLPSLGWIAAIIALLVAIFRGAIEDAGKKLVSSLGEALYSRFAGYKPFWMLALRRYKTALYKKHHELKLPFRPGRPLEMKEVYVPVKVSGTGIQTADTLIDAYQAIEKHKKLVVLGAPGAGKSILLRHVALTYAERDLDQLLVPVLVELNRLNDAGTSMFEHLAAILKQNDFPNGETFLKSWLKAGQLLLMFDGLDEVNTDRREQVSAAIRDLLAEYSGCHAIVTCRTQVYKGEFADWTDQTLEVAEFSDQQIQRFLFAWQKELPPGKSAEHLWANLGERPRILTLARNPLMLTIIAFLYADTEFVLPHSRAEFYDTAVTVLFEQWKEKRNRYKAASKRLVMQHLALFMQDTAAERGQERRTIDLPVLLTEIKKVLPALNLKDDEAQPLLDEIIERSGLMISFEGGMKYQFSHLTLQEFFAAHALGDDGDGLLIRFKADKDAWRETIKLWCGLEHDSTPLLAEIYNLEKLTVFESLADAQMIEPAFIDKMLGEFAAYIRAGETNQSILRMFASAAADPRARGKQLFSGLVRVVTQTETTFEQKVSAAQTLALTGLPESAKILLDIIRTNARLSRIIRPMLVGIGDNAINPLIESIDIETIGALHILYEIGTPLAAQKLVPFLWHASSDVCFYTAWRLAALISRPELETSINSVFLTPEQRKAPQLDWVWKPFDETGAKNISTVAGRIAYLLDTCPPKLIPSQPLPTLDSRLVVPLCLVAPQTTKLCETEEMDKPTIKAMRRLAWSYEQPLADDVIVTAKNTMTDYLEKLRRYPAWTYIFGKLELELQANLLLLLFDKNIKPSRDDWRQIFHPVNYDFSKSWQKWILRLLNIVFLAVSVWAGVMMIIQQSSFWNISVLWSLLSISGGIFYVISVWDNKVGEQGVFYLYKMWIWFTTGNLFGWFWGPPIGFISGQGVGMKLEADIKSRWSTILRDSLTGMFAGLMFSILGTLAIQVFGGILSVFVGLLLFFGIYGIYHVRRDVQPDDPLLTKISSWIGSLLVALGYPFIFTSSKFLIDSFGQPILLGFWILWLLTYRVLIFRSELLERRAQNPMHQFIQYLPNAPKQPRQKRSWIFDIFPFRGIDR